MPKIYPFIYYRYLRNNIFTIFTDQKYNNKNKKLKWTWKSVYGEQIIYKNAITMHINIYGVYS